MTDYGNAETDNHDDGAGTMEACRRNEGSVCDHVCVFVGQGAGSGGRGGSLLLCGCECVVLPIADPPPQALYFGNAKGGLNHGGAGKGPWIMADMENALWGADKVESNEPPINHPFVTAMIKGWWLPSSAQPSAKRPPHPFSPLLPPPHPKIATYTMAGQVTSGPPLAIGPSRAVTRTKATSPFIGTESVLRGMRP